MQFQHAIDFLHKPFDNDRFEKALDQAIDRIAMQDQSVLNERLIQMVDDFRSQSQESPFILKIKDKGRERSINLYDVLYIEADGIRLQQFNGTAAGQTVFHIHMHLVPCYEGVELRGHTRDFAPTELLEQQAAMLRDALAIV